MTRFYPKPLKDRHVPTLSILLLMAALLAWAPHHPTQADTYDWLQFNFDSLHSGNNTKESTITPANVSGLKPLFRVALGTLPNPAAAPAIADGAPVYLSGVQTASGMRDLLFLTTYPGDLIALDAHSGQEIWIAHRGLANCKTLTPSACYTTSSPAVDPQRQYVYGYGVDGFVHKFQVSDGKESVGAGWPELATKKPTLEKGSSALSIATDRAANTYLYVSQSGYFGDAGDYQGHLTTINLATGAQHVFNALCSSQTVHLATSPASAGETGCDRTQAGIWSRPGATYVVDTDRVYVVTGNGNFNGHDAWGDSVLALAADGTGDKGRPLANYTPANQATLDSQDIDLGSTSPALLPVVNDKHYAIQGGKDALLRLLNLDNLAAGTLATRKVPQDGEVLSQPAVWTDPSTHQTWVFVGNDGGISGIEIPRAANGNASLSGRTWIDKANSCASPIVANGLLFCASSNYLYALDPMTGKEKWHDTSIGRIHWESPIVVNGVLYITDGDSYNGDTSSHLTAYWLGSDNRAAATGTSAP